MCKDSFHTTEYKSLLGVCVYTYTQDALCVSNSVCI